MTGQISQATSLHASSLKKRNDMHNQIHEHLHVFHTTFTYFLHFFYTFISNITHFLQFLHICYTMTIEELHKLWDKKNKGKSAPTEHDLQVQCLRWLHFTHKDVLCYAIPNGAYTTKTTARKLVAEGVTHGVPDLCIPMARGGYHALYIEMKNGKAGRLSDHQKEMIARLQLLGNKVVICRSLADFIREVETYLNS